MDAVVMESVDHKATRVAVEPALTPDRLYLVLRTKEVIRAHERGEIVRGIRTQPVGMLAGDRLKPIGGS